MAAVADAPIRVAPAATMARAVSAVWIPPEAFTPGARRPRVARNVAASLGHGTRREYKHRDLGFLVDLGGLAAAANPLNVPCPEQRQVP
jgi:hypothetical protein